MLLASHQTTLETLVLISPALHYISPVMNVALSLQREIPSLLDVKEPQGGQHLHLTACWTQPGHLFLASADPFLKK